MSVLLSKRSESKTQFISTAINLQKEVLELLTKLSVRYQRVFVEPATRVAFSVVQHCEIANNIFIKTPDDIAQRRMHLNEAYGQLKFLDELLDQQFQILLDNPEGIFDKTVESKMTPEKAKEYLYSKIEMMGNQINEEFRMIKGVINSDQDRLKTLK